MATGENAGTWGQITNTNLYLLQQAIGGYEAISIAGGAQTTALTMSNGAISNARNAVIKLTGTITGNQVVTIPTAIEKTYVVANGTVGAFTVEFKQEGGTGVTFAAADKSTKILFADGTNIVETGNTTPIITQINDTNVNEQIKFTTTASAVNEFTITNAATANAPEISATGGDTNIDLKITPKGSGKINLDGIKFPNADGSAGQFLQTDGSGNLSFAAAGIAWQSIVTGATLSAVAGRGYWINTTSNACTVTLPASASNGDTIILADYARKWATNAVTINQNSLNFQGSTSPNPIYNTDGQSVTLVYSGATQGWIPTTDDAVTFETPQPYSIDFLVVAGGGGGGGQTGGGGGAGGFRTSTQSASTGTVITVTVGDGGAGGIYSPSGLPGVSGSNSSISGSGLTTITSAGGGGGGGYETSPSGVAGGSGGGGGFYSTAGASGNTPSTSPSQGNNGGASSSTSYNAGGGGGAGAVGTDGNGSSTGGQGGNGTANSITGSSVTYAGGGGGTRQNSTSASGGTGGGGQGSGNSSPSSNSGGANTGGGGGGSRDALGASGGKGVVILSVPTASYSSTTTGSPTVTTSGSNTILQFNGSGSYTA
jgi:hypothetical protein